MSDEQLATCPECHSPFERWNGFIALNGDKVCSTLCRDKHNGKTIKAGIDKLERERNTQEAKR